MRIGDRVSVVDDTIEGKIVEINDTVVKIIDDNDFEYEFPLSQLVLKTTDLYENITIPMRKKTDFFSKSPSLSCIDLHIEKLTNEKHLSASERLFIQRESLINGIEKAKRNGIKKIEIIHGLGDGIVQNMVHEVLSFQLNLEFHNKEILHHQSGGVVVYLS